MLEDVTPLKTMDLCQENYVTFFFLYLCFPVVNVRSHVGDCPPKMATGFGNGPAHSVKVNLGEFCFIPEPSAIFPLLPAVWYSVLRMRKCVGGVFMRLCEWETFCKCLFMCVYRGRFYWPSFFISNWPSKRVVRGLLRTLPVLLNRTSCEQTAQSDTQAWRCGERNVLFFFLSIVIKCII